MENSDEAPSVRELRRAAKVAAQLNDFLERCSRHKTLPLLIGYDLDDLSQRFTDAADEMEKANG